MQQLEPENPSMTLDEASMQRSKNFIKTLQELKNLRSQLYSAAEYCEKSYLHNEQKQMVLDNLKDYAVRAVVNAIDHLGTVAYKLSDLFEQQTLDVLTVDLKISWLNQQMLTCQAYTDKEGLRQQRLSTITPRHHKHYILPNSTNRKVQNCLLKETDLRQKNIQSQPRPSGTPASQTLSWYLASETKSSLDRALNASDVVLNPKASPKTSQVFRVIGSLAKSCVNSQVFHVIDDRDAPSSTPIAHHLSGEKIPSSATLMNTTGAARKDPWEANKSLLAFRSFEQPGRRQISQPPARSKSMLSSFFVNHKSATGAA
ncbi:protein ABIL1-like [Aristolochia californica]|uniref:protein ABIL1-like n=1 Tax=Aristolochia californica TaxID=171875 RepID=UPI0035DCC243